MEDINWTDAGKQRLRTVSNCIDGLQRLFHNGCK